MKSTPESGAPARASWTPCGRDVFCAFIALEFAYRLTGAFWHHIDERL